jgi:S1-C subfamily serine protease
VSDGTEWMIPEAAQPRPEAVAFDLGQALASVVRVRSEIPPDAFTASILGTERCGHGVLIGENGLILTIGYLVTEAETIWLTGSDGSALPGHVVGYDQTTGFGLVQALGRLRLPTLPIGSARAVTPGDQVIVAGEGGREHALQAKVVAKREFAGYWEYVLDEAIFTAPPHPSWGGTACIAADGRLAGIGSLFVQEARGQGIASQGNMIVPIDLLRPVFDDLQRLGRADRPPRPWLGMYTSDAEGTLFVAGVAPSAPADRAGVRPGDIVLEVAGMRVTDLATMFRRVWSLGPAGTEIPLTIARDGEAIRTRIRSADRDDFLRKPQLH